MIPVRQCRAAKRRNPDHATASRRSFREARAAHPSTTYTTSVCTGAILLAAAGILEGKVATTHWMAYDQLSALGATPTEQRVVTVR